MRHAWTLLILAGCHDPEAESLRARVSAQQKELAELRTQTPSEPADAGKRREQEQAIGRLEGENEMLRKKVDLYLDMINEKPPLSIGGGSASGDGTSVVVNGDFCWVLYSRKADLKTKDFEIQQRLTLACYRNSGSDLRLVDVREIAPDLEMLQYRGGSPSVTEVIKAIRDSKKK